MKYSKLPRLRTNKQVINELKFDSGNIMSEHDITCLLTESDSIIYFENPLEDNEDREVINYDKLLNYLYNDEIE